MIAILNPVEQVRLDRSRIIELGMRLGPIGAEDLVSRAMEELAVLLAKLRRAFEDKDFDALVSIATTIRQISDHVGMDKVSRVAGDLLMLAHSGQDAALAAVVTRLHRLGEQTLLAVWDLNDISI